MPIVFVAIATLFVTLLGGFLAIKYKDKLHVILGFSAGAVIGVAFFDLIPEAIELSAKTYSTEKIVALMALGFSIYLFVDRMIVLHSHGEEGHAMTGHFGAVTISMHSLLDGIGVGLAFQVSSTLGITLAIAVLAHRLLDGINTVHYILKSKGDGSRAIRWLIVDAFAPVIGLFSTLFFTVSESTLGILLAIFAGFFFYIGASDLIPESHHAHPVKWTTFATILGMLFIYAIVALAH